MSIRFITWTKTRCLLRIAPTFNKFCSLCYNHAMPMSLVQLPGMKNDNVNAKSSRLLCSKSVKCEKKTKIFETTSFIKASTFLERPAICDMFGLYTYKEMLGNAAALADKLNTKKVETSQKRCFCCLLCSNDSRYVYSLWGAWLSGYVVVPLSGKYPISMLEYFLDDCKADVILYTKEFESVATKLFHNKPTLNCQLIENIDKRIQNDIQFYLDEWMTFKGLKALGENPALIIYTSGTTGNPKGVLHTHGTLNAMVQGMLKAWDWTSKDVIIHCLPLNHVHGVINALLTPLSCGALTIMLPRFDPYEVWKLILNDDNVLQRPTIFMGVPTMYSLLMSTLEQHNQKHSGALNLLSEISKTSDLKDAIKKACLNNIRLFVSGSAPLQIPVMNQWEELTGHKLLERYGMTEIGMALTNPLHGPRISGAVGLPFPTVEVAIAHRNGNGGLDISVRSDENSTQILNKNSADGGELLVRGRTVFKEYLNRPEATKEAFTSDGWFITGDTARYDELDRTYRILGRTSVDVIKCGGYKLSALEIENQMARHPIIKEVAVLGLPDQIWGQKVAALVVLKKYGGTKREMTESILEWCRDNMASHQVPKLIKKVDILHRNAMGKLNKKELQSQHFGDSHSKEF